MSVLRRNEIKVKKVSKDNGEYGKQVKISDEERDLTTVRIQHDPVWKVQENILCNWKGRGVFYKAKIVTIVQYDDQPVYVVEYPGFKYQKERVLQEESFERFLANTEENKQKAAEIYKRATKLAEDKRQSRGSTVRQSGIGNSSLVSAFSTPVSRPPTKAKTSNLIESNVGKSSLVTPSSTPVGRGILKPAKRRRESVEGSDPNSTASPNNSFRPEEKSAVKRPKLSRQSAINTSQDSEEKSAAKHPRLSLQSAINTSEDSVVPETPESDLAKGAAALEILPAKLKEILEIDRQRVEIDYKLPNMPPRFSVFDIINGYIKILGTVDGNSEKEQSKEGKYAMTIPDKSLVNCAISVVVELLKCFDISTVKLLLYYYEKPFFEDLSNGEVKLAQAEVVDEKTGKESEGSQVNQEVKLPEMSTIVGFPYLLRLFENFADVLTEKNKWKLTDTNSTICLQYFINYLADHAGEFFEDDRDYHTPSIQYFARIFK